VNNLLKRLRGTVVNALVWGLGWSTAGFAVFVVLRLAGGLPDAVSWTEGLVLALRLGLIGGIAGAMFAGVIRLLYRGRRLSEISWVRFGIAAGVATGVFVPLFLQTMNLLSGDGLVPWRLVLDDGVWTAVFGAAAGGGTLRLAQHAALRGRRQGQLDPSESPERLEPAAEQDAR
jgi:hypothetical protein